MISKNLQLSATWKQGEILIFDFTYLASLVEKLICLFFMSNIGKFN